MLPAPSHSKDSERVSDSHNHPEGVAAAFLCAIFISVNNCATNKPIALQDLAFDEKFVFSLCLFLCQHDHKKGKLFRFSCLTRCPFCKPFILTVMRVMGGGVPPALKIWSQTILTLH